MPKKPSRTTFQHRLNEMVSALRSDILTGKLPRGLFLPSIVQLGKQYQLSINSVQKGLNQLEDDDLIEKIPRVGIRVKASDPSEKITLSLGYYPSLLNDMELEAIIGQFQEEYPHITVQRIPLQYERYNEVTQYYLENELVDIITINHINFLNFHDDASMPSELFEPLDAHPGVQPFLMDAFTHAGQRYALPAVCSPVVLCYNKRMIEELGLPLPSADWKWPDFMTYLDQLDSRLASGISFYFYPANYNRWPIFLLQSSSPQKDEAPSPLPPAIPLIDGMQACYDLIHRNKQQLLLLPDDDLNVEEVFAQQKIAIMMTTYFNVNKLRKEKDLPFELAPLPYVHTPKTLLLTIGLAVNRRSKQKQAAMAFMNCVLSYSAQLRVRQNTYSIPALQAAADWQGEEALYRPSSFALYKELADTYVPLSDLKLNKDEKDALLRVMNMYWTDMLSKEEAIAQLADIGFPPHIIVDAAAARIL